jgi:hydroxypyruvate isomerase
MKAQRTSIRYGGLSRRDFIAGVGSAVILSATAVRAQVQPQASGRSRFKLKYAPPFGMFGRNGGKDLADQMKFVAEQGFSAMFDNGLMGRSVQEQQTIAAQAERLGMTLGPFVAYADFGAKTFVTRDKAIREMFIGRMRQAVEVAKRANAKWTVVVPGRYDESLEWDYQTANVVENLKYCAEVCEPSGLVIVIEPLNAWDHPGLFLTKVAQAYQICRAVASPCCKIVNDLYHQQITEGSLIANIDRAWEEIASFHIGDNPGRKEPTTGEINYRNIFGHLHRKGYQGVLCMEHGASKPGKEGEKAIIEAYVTCDSF